MDKGRKRFDYFVIILLSVIVFAIAGLLAGSIVAADLGLVKLLWFLGLLMFLSTITGGGTVIDRSIKRNMRPTSVICEDGSYVRVDSYTQGLYVGDDFIVAEGSDPMVGESGQAYRKY
ncbi:MAG: hypothetical protein II290_02010 [Oscillospiraceae bacterium]|nr:hypothetical protein [Oscillospiraceae bacterium]